MGKCDEQRATSTERVVTVSRGGHSKSWKARNVNAGAEECVVNERLGAEASRPEDVMMSFCLGTCSTAKACVLLDQHR